MKMAIISLHLTSHTSPPSVTQILHFLDGIDTYGDIYIPWV